MFQPVILQYFAAKQPHYDRNKCMELQFYGLKSGEIHMDEEPNKLVTGTRNE